MQMVAEGIWKIEGQFPGPRIALLGGIHGNERPGITVVEYLRDVFASGEKTLTRGTLFLILGNLKAIEQDRRFTQNGQDLNRLFSDDRLTQPPDGTYEDKRVREIAPLLRSVDVSIDVHATNKPSCPFIYSATTSRHEKIYQHFFVNRILTDPEHLLAGQPITTDEFVDLHGGIGICLELGWTKNENKSAIKKTIENLFALLENRPTHPTPKKIYRLSHSLVLTDQRFSFAHGIGKHSFQSCQKGQVIGYEGTQVVTSLVSGVIVYPKIREHWQLGKPVGFLAEKII